MIHLDNKKTSWPQWFGDGNVIQHLWCKISFSISSSIKIYVIWECQGEQAATPPRIFNKGHLIGTNLHWLTLNTVSAHKEGLRLLIFNILAAQITCSSHRMKERESTQNTRSWGGEEKWPQEAREHLTVRGSECVTQPKDERGQVRQTQADQYETNREPRLTRWIKYNISQLSTLIISDY